MHDRTKPDPAFEHARYASLNGRAVSDEAKAFIDMLAPLAEDQEVASGVNRRAKSSSSSGASP
jgi:hypothetical protein